MHVSERKSAILDALGRDQKVQAGELAARFGVSEDTIRRDLRALADEGLIRRVYGGAVPHTPAGATYADRVDESTDAKAAIARAAVRFIRPGQTVFLDAGTTAVAVARNLPADLRVTVITHNVPAAAALVDKPAVDVVVLGGQLMRAAAATVGSGAVDGYRRCRADVCVLGVASLHPQVGLGVFHHDDAEVKRAMLAASAEVMAVAAGEKLNTAAPFLVGPLSAIDRLVTDAKAVPPEVAAAVAREGIELVRAG